MLSQRMVDEDYEQRLGIVSRSESAAAEQRRAHGRKVVAFDQDGRGQVKRAGLGGNVAVAGDRRVALNSVSGQERREPDAGCAGEGRKAAEQFLVELIDSGLGAVLLAREAVCRDDSVVGPIAEVRFAHLLKTAQQQARGGEQDESNRDFRNHQAGTQARVSCAGGPGAAAFLQRLVDAGADGGKGGRDPADHAGDDGQNERKGGDDPVETDVADEGKGLRQQVGADAQRNDRRA